jgi:phosphoglycolate phosphatase-like HAD superfamily hydrolase
MTAEQPVPTVPGCWPDAIFFDFDGVVVESADIKTEAFGRLFADHGERIESAIVAYHVANAGLSRYDKFDHIYANILNRPLPPELRDELGSRFEQLVFDEVVNAPFVPGALEFFRSYARSCPCYLISATPHDELMRILQTRDLDGFFRGVFGSPAKKGETICAVMEAERFERDRVLVVGDSRSDADAAAHAGVRFVGRVRPGAPNPFEMLEGVPLIPDLRELVPLLSTA